MKELLHNKIYNTQLKNKEGEFSFVNYGSWSKIIREEIHHWPKAKKSLHNRTHKQHTTALYWSNIGMLEFLAFVSV